MVVQIFGQDHRFYIVHNRIRNHHVEYKILTCLNQLFIIQHYAKDYFLDNDILTFWLMNTYGLTLIIVKLRFYKRDYFDIDMYKRYVSCGCCGT